MQWIQSILASILAVFGGVSDGATMPVAPVESESSVVVESVAATTTAENTAADNTQETQPSEAAVGDDMAATMPASETSASEMAVAEQNITTMLVAGGCFWCVEADLEKTPGVISAVSGYAGGTTENPTYDDYGAGGHREVVAVTYDANRISFEDVLIVTMKTTDPTDDDGTFADRGDKYSAAFYYETEQQRQTIVDLIAEVDQFGPYDAPLAIDVEARPPFWPAEDFHQDYYKGAFSQLKYSFYRNASGRDDFIKQHWDEDKTPNLPWRTNTNETSMHDTKYPWSNYQKPDDAALAQQLDATTYKVTQQNGTERAGSSPLDAVDEAGIFVDVLSGEPLFSSRDKFDSGTGWPSFVKPITPEAITEHQDRKLFVTRTEIRSAIADNHLGHVFDDGPKDRGGLRYCMNGVALRFVPETEMAAEGYVDFLKYI